MAKQREVRTKIKKELVVRINSMKKWTRWSGALAESMANQRLIMRALNLLLSDNSQK